MGEIRQLCREHANLDEADIERVEEVARSLLAVADLTGADVFLDCPTADPDMAVVVAHARPSHGISLYEGDVVGALALRENEPAVLRTLEIGMPTRDTRATTQEHKTVSQNVSPVKGGSGRVVCVLIAEKDITEDEHARRSLSLLSSTTEQLMEALVSSRQQEHSLPYHVTDGIVMFNREGKSVYINPVAETIYRKLGFRDPLEWNDFENLAIGDVDFRDILARNEVRVVDSRVGGMMLEVKYAVMKGQDGSETGAGVVMLVRDETEVREREKELILKSVAIQEIHHRVKNNLQTIASLLRLQSRRVENEYVKNAFHGSISRVLSIAATHEILAQGGMDDVDVKTMLHRIRSGLLNHATLSGVDVAISVEGDTFTCPSDMATSIALVVNEAIQNCLKYAFPGRESGRIVIRIAKGKSYGNISIQDDGEGFDDKKAPTDSLGFRIIRSIVNDKLRGTLQTESDGTGTRVFFDFPLEPGPSGTDPGLEAEYGRKRPI